MNCARCGNALHRVPMFDLPRRVKEFSCMCCGERFWTTQGEATMFSDLGQAKAASTTAPEKAREFTPPIAHLN